MRWLSCLFVVAFATAAYADEPKITYQKFELAKSKQNLIRALPAQFGTNASTAGAFAELALYGLPDNWYASYAAGVRKVTAKDVKTAAKTLIPWQRMVISIVGDMAKIRTDLNKLNLGDAAMHDLYGTPVQ